MPAKSKSPEAAQRKVWKAELKQLQAAGRKVDADHNREIKRLEKEIVAAEKKLPLFFKEVHSFDRVPKDGEKFRKIGRANLEPDAFAALIRAATARDKDGIPKSTLQIAWDDARPPAEVPA